MLEIKEVKNMGAWGPGLYSDDVTCDVKEEYIGYLKKGMTSEEAMNKVIESWEAYDYEDYDTPLVWLALADTQWKYGRLTDEVKNTAIKLMPENLELWKENEKLYSKRKKVLEELEVKLNSQQPEEKKIYIRKPYITDWQNGDTYAYKFDGEYAKENGFYNKYIFFVKVDNDTWENDCIIPRVHVYNVISDNILSIEELKKYEYLPQCGLHMYKKNKINNIDSYLISFLNTSLRVIPKNKLIFLGNDKSYKKIPNKDPNSIGLYTYIFWKEFEEYIINVYNNWNE